MIEKYYDLFYDFTKTKRTATQRTVKYTAYKKNNTNNYFKKVIFCICNIQKWDRLYVADSKVLIDIYENSRLIF